MESTNINITKHYTYVSCYNSDEKIDSMENIVKHVYLVIKNLKEAKKNEINFENLNFIRSILKYRYILTSELASDIQSGAIRELFDDDVFLDILTQPKTISHGESEDIKKHLASIENKYSLYEQYGEELDAKFYDIVNDLTLFSNLLISFFHSLKVSNDLGKKHQFEEVLKLTPLSFILKTEDKKEFHSYDSNEIDFEAKSKIDFSYSNMNEEFTKRFTLYKKCLSYNRKIEIRGDDFEKIDGLINLSLLDENSYWISIAFIHILIRNAEHHGDPDSVIEIFFEKNNKSYDLVVKNKKSLEKLNFKEGITIKALKYIFGNSSRFNLVFPNSKSTDFIAKIENFIIIDN